jgi:hypothetical protein
MIFLMWSQRIRRTIGAFLSTLLTEPLCETPLTVKQESLKNAQPTELGSCMSCSILKNRMDAWISRDEGKSKLAIGYKDQYIKTLESQLNQQAKMLNWIRTEMQLMYPNIIDRAKEKTSG